MNDNLPPPKLGLEAAAQVPGTPQRVSRRDNREDALWRQIKAMLKTRIQAMSPGDPLATYDELAAEMECSVAPVKQAMRDLAREGWVSMRRGRPAKVLWTNSFGASARRAGHRVETRVFHQAYRPLERSEEGIGREFGLEPDRPCLVCGRVRIADGRPAALQMTYINPAVVPDPERFFLDHDLASSSLRDLYTGLAVRPLRVSAVLKAASADERERTLLSLPEMSPVLRSHQQTLVEWRGGSLLLEVMLATYTPEIDYRVERLPDWNSAD